MHHLKQKIGTQLIRLAVWQQIKHCMLTTVCILYNLFVNVNVCT